MDAMIAHESKSTDSSFNIAHSADKAYQYSTNHKNQI